MCIVTSKDGKRTKEIIRHFNIPIKYSFSPSRNLRGKPHPDKINKAFSKSRISYILKFFEK